MNISLTKAARSNPETSNGEIRTGHIGKTRGKL